MWCKTVPGTIRLATSSITGAAAEQFTWDHLCEISTLTSWGLVGDHHFAPLRLDNGQMGRALDSAARALAVNLAAWIKSYVRIEVLTDPSRTYDEPSNLTSCKPRETTDLTNPAPQTSTLVPVPSIPPTPSSPRQKPLKALSTKAKWNRGRARRTALPSEPCYPTMSAENPAWPNPMASPTETLQLSLIHI